MRSSLSLDITSSERDYWIPHLRRLAKDNAELRDKVRKLEKEVHSLQEEADYQGTIARKANTELLVLLGALKPPVS